MSASFIRIGGELVGDALLQTLQVTQRLNSHWWCKIECRQTEDERFAVEQALGQDLQVLTFDEDDSENIIFDGFILDVELKYEVFGSYTARLTAVTQSYKMSLTPRKSYFFEKSLKDIASELAAHSGLKAQVQHP